MKIDHQLYEEIRSHVKTINQNEARPKNTSSDPDLEFDRKRKRGAEIDRYLGDTKLRKKLAEDIIRLIKFWVIGLFVVLFANSWVFHLSDTVLAVFLGTTTAAVIGLGVIVLKGFFQYMDQNVKDIEFKDKQ